MSTSRLPSRQLPRKQYSVDFTREVVEQSCVRSASIAAVARENGIKANILWRWRHKYEAGKLGSAEQTAFLPITIEQAPLTSVQESSPGSSPEPPAD